MAITDDRKAEIRAHLERDGYQEWQIAAFLRFEDEGRHGKAQRVLHGKVCGALRHKSRGHCLAPPMPGRRRCRLHGGLALGPTTEEGRQAISEAQKRRWAAWRAAGSPPPTSEASANMSKGALRRWAPHRRKKEREARHQARLAEFKAASASAG